MVDQKKLSFAQCIVVNNWYECPISIMIFVFFIVLFIYFTYILTVNWNNILDLTESQEDDKQLKRLEGLYVINLIGTFICFAVIMFFLGKAIGDLTFIKFMNKYLIIIAIVFIIFVSSYNISTYNKGDKTHNTTQTINGTILGISLLIIIIVVLFYYYGSEIQHFFHLK